MIMKDSDHCENIDEHRKEMSIKPLNTRRKIWEVENIMYNLSSQSIKYFLWHCGNLMSFVFCCRKTPESPAVAPKSRL